MLSLHEGYQNLNVLDQENIQPRVLQNHSQSQIAEIVQPEQLNNQRPQINNAFSRINNLNRRVRNTQLSTAGCRPFSQFGYLLFILYHSYQSYNSNEKDIKELTFFEYIWVCYYFYQCCCRLRNNNQSNGIGQFINFILFGLANYDYFTAEEALMSTKLFLLINLELYIVCAMFLIIVSCTLSLACCCAGIAGIYALFNKKIKANQAQKRDLFLIDLVKKSNIYLTQKRQGRIENLENICAICLKQDVDTPLPCKHVFHFQCIKTWFMQQRNTCPVCRANSY